MNEILDLITKGGALGVCALLIYALIQGSFRTKQEIEAKNQNILDLKQQLVDMAKAHDLAIGVLREEFTSRIGALDRDNLYLRDALLKALQGVQRGAAAAERVVAIAEQQTTQPSATPRS